MRRYALAGLLIAIAAVGVTPEPASASPASVEDVSMAKELHYASRKVLDCAVATPADALVMVEVPHVDRVEFHSGPRTDTGGAAISVFVGVRINDPNADEIMIDTYSGGPFVVQVRQAGEGEAIKRLYLRNRVATPNGSLWMRYGEVASGYSYL